MDETATEQVRSTQSIFDEAVKSRSSAALLAHLVSLDWTAEGTLPDASGTLALQATTLAGYGITDGVGTTGAQSIAGTKTFTGALTAIAANVTLQDNNLTIQDNVDPTKSFQFQASGIATATNRVFTVPDANGTLALSTVFGSAANGLTPASGGGTANFLRADGTWAAPTAGAGGSTSQMQYNNAGALAGASEVLVEGNQLRLAETTTFTAPATAGAKLISVARDGQSSQLAMLAQDGIPHPIMMDLAQETIMMLLAAANQTAMTAVGTPAPNAVGTATAFTPTTSTLYQKIPVEEWLVTTAATTAIAGFRTLNGMLTVGGAAAGKGGFKWFGRFGPATGVATATSRCVFGLRGLTSAPTDAQPSNQVSCAFFGWDDSDTNMQFMSNDASRACTKVNLGASFPKPSADRTKVFDCFMYSPPGTTQALYWRIKDIATGAVALGTVTATADLPAAAARLSPTGWLSVGGTSAVIGFGLHAMQWQQIVID